ncbi:alpha-protein kinase 2 [Corythoichthys intestinalis]|uniref:alpha-protein kinase 2 n=1 Tax=Corythoichthys intestinalis TaxID=161448 RepID=UPI0025A66781|nr:alpha-protein kinase 2 [Corythoichthys intestinalis]
MDLTPISTDNQRQSPPILSVSESNQDSGYFSLLGDFMDPPAQFVPLLPDLSTGLISPRCEIYTQPILIPNTRHQIRVESLSLESEHSRTAYLRSLSDTSEDYLPTDPVSDLYIFESETQDFILSPTAREIKVDPNHDDSPFAFCDSAKNVTHSKALNKDWVMLASESELESLTDVTPRGPRSVSPAEQWADACQYLDKRDVFPSSTSSELSLEETWVSGYTREGIGWGGDDNIGWRPPVERWSSVESWASALSDWNVIGMPAQELTATFSEIGAEIDALTEALADIQPYNETEQGMGLQDRPVGGIIQEESIQCEQEYFAFQTQVGDIVQSLGDSTANTQTQPEEPPVANIADENLSLVSSGEDLDILNPAWTHLRDVDLPRFVQFLGTENLKEDKIVLKIVEDGDVSEQPAEPTNEQQSEDGLLKVTEDHSIHLPDSPPNQGTDPGACSTNDEHFEASSEDMMNLCMPLFKSVPSLNTLTDHDLESQMISPVSCPTFILPVAPLEINSALEYRRSSLDGDQTRTFNDTHPRIWTLGPSEEVQELSVIPEMNRTIPDIPHVSKSAKPNNQQQPKENHATSGKTQPKSDVKPCGKKEKSAFHHHTAPAPKKQDNSAHLASGKQKQTQENHSTQPVKDTITLIENAKPHGKKKKKHHHNTENSANVKDTNARMEISDAKTNTKIRKDAETSDHPAALKPSHGEHVRHNTDGKSKHVLPCDDTIKKRRLSKDKYAKFLDSKPNVSTPSKAEDRPKVDVRAPNKKTSSDVVKHKTSPPAEEPKVIHPIQAESVSGDPQSLSLWCQFTTVFREHTITWKQEAVVLLEVKRSAGDESRASLTIFNASHKDLGKYQCCLSSLQGTITLDYLLTYEVLREIVILPSPNIAAILVEAGYEAEDVQCSQLLFKEDFLSEQYFGENQSVSIVTEKTHFGEGMHRRAFRTRLCKEWVPLLPAGPSCVLKVHTAISYGTKNNDDLVQKNFSLAVEECHVQNTAREYIKEYTAATQSVDAFGEVPEIIPIYLVHRPSSDIPYATLEEELIGDFVKYSVKDGKEINLMRRDSEAGRKCCAFQHWVYQRTDGNLLVTDMQGVGMKLTDVGIATCKKGYKGFKGNCATSFIDQFKVLHQCNTYCEILGLSSLQPKAAKKVGCASRSKAQPSAGPKKKMFGPSLKGKS